MMNTNPLATRNVAAWQVGSNHFGSRPFWLKILLFALLPRPPMVPALLALSGLECAGTVAFEERILTLPMAFWRQLGGCILEPLSSASGVSTFPTAWAIEVPLTSLLILLAVEQLLLCPSPGPLASPVASLLARRGVDAEPANSCASAVKNILILLEKITRTTCIPLSWQRCMGTVFLDETGS